MYLLFCTDFYIFRNFVFFVFLVVQYRRSVIYKIKRLDTNTRDFGYKPDVSVSYAFIITFAILTKLKTSQSAKGLRLPQCNWYLQTV